MTSDLAGGRESQIIDAFVDLADSLVADYDQLDFLYRLLEHGIPLAGFDAGGVLLAFGGGLHVVASSSEASEEIEVFEVQNHQGPGFDAYTSGHAVRVDRLADAADRWPQFVPMALDRHWSSVIALPIRLRDLVVGAFVALSSQTQLDDANTKLLRGFADVAAIAVLQRRTIDDASEVNRQLNLAFDARLKIEQAKGMVAERNGMKPGDAFEAIRRHARSTNQRVSDIATAVVAGDVDAGFFASR